MYNDAHDLMLLTIKSTPGSGISTCPSRRGHHGSRSHRLSPFELSNDTGFTSGARAPRVLLSYSNTLLLPFCVFSITPQPPFYPLNLISLFSLSSQLVSLRSSIRPLVLYRKTFLVFYSAPVKPGAYFQCPKLIANVRTDPSSPSTPSQPPPFLALTVRIRGTFS